MTLQDDIKNLPAQDFATLKTWIVTTETDRRAATPLAEEAKAAIITELRQTGAVPTPPATTTPPTSTTEADKVPAWTNPGTAHQKMYTRGQIVRHGGKIWVSEASGLNSWEPGATGVYSNIWRDITPTPPATPDGTPAPAAPDGTQANPYPFKAGFNLTAGQYVTYNGSTYKVLQAHTTQDGWNPPAVPALFTKI